MSSLDAPLAPAAPTPAPDSVPCGRCGSPIDPNAAAYSENGELLCRRCEALETIDTGDQRVVSSIVGASMGSVSLGLVSFCFNPFFLFSVMAVLSGVGTITTLLRHPEYRAKMAWRYPVSMGAAGIGILLGLAFPAMLIFGTFLAALVGR